MLPTLLITMGDPAGIGAEILVKAAAHPEVFDRCQPVAIGDLHALQQAVRGAGLSLALRPISSLEALSCQAGVLPVLECSPLPMDSWRYGEISPACGEAAFQYIRQGISLALQGKADAVVTGPICKEALHLSGHKYSGHTEIFAQLTGTRDYAMVLCHESLRVIHVSTHASLRQACERVTRERVEKVISLAEETLQALGIEHPRIAVAGLNPHASENGLFGSEEQQEIIPAIENARARGLNVSGPLPADTVFLKAAEGMFDMVVAMYHDQGHIPVKLLGFQLGASATLGGVNLTAGLPIIRTSVDHGTAFDRAGQWCSHEGSMLDAIAVACRMIPGVRQHKG